MSTDRMVPNKQAWVNTPFVHCLRIRSNNAGAISYENQQTKAWVRVRDPDSIASIVAALPSHLRQTASQNEGLMLPPRRPKPPMASQHPPALDMRSLDALHNHVRQQQADDFAALDKKIAELKAGS